MKIYKWKWPLTFLENFLRRRYFRFNFMIQTIESKKEKENPLLKIFFFEIRDLINRSVVRRSYLLKFHMKFALYNIRPLWLEQMFGQQYWPKRLRGKYFTATGERIFDDPMHARTFNKFGVAPLYFSSSNVVNKTTKTGKTKPNIYILLIIITSHLKYLCK